MRKPALSGGKCLDRCIVHQSSLPGTLGKKRGISDRKMQNQRCLYRFHALRRARADGRGWPRRQSPKTLRDCGVLSGRRGAATPRDRRSDRAEQSALRWQSQTRPCRSERCGPLARLSRERRGPPGSFVGSFAPRGAPEPTLLRRQPATEAVRPSRLWRGRGAEPIGARRPSAPAPRLVPLHRGMLRRARHCGAWPELPLWFPRDRLGRSGRKDREPHRRRPSPGLRRRA
mgnify:CR=1 FL=1